MFQPVLEESVPIVGRMGEAGLVISPACPASSLDHGHNGKKEGDAHAAAGQLSLFTVGTKEPKRQKWMIELGWAIGGHVCLAAVVRTSQQCNFLVFL